MIRQLSTPTGTSSRSQRRGITLIIVLMLIAVTMALSYSMVRSQISVLQIQNNSTRRDQAYEAALTGISAALRKMNNNSWSGVDVSLTGSVTTNDTFKVTFTTGDPSLTTASSNYADYPYRVTLLSTGTSVDPVHGTSTTRRIQTVVRLITVQLGSETSEWPSMQQYTVYQTNTKPFTLNVPCRIEGSLRLQGAVTVCPDYSWSTSARSRYMRDLVTMGLAGLGSNNPLTGPLKMPTSNTDSTTLSLLKTEMGLSVTSISATAKSVLTYPNQLTTYRIYPGGKQYQVPQLGSSLQNTTLTPDPATNPLGIYFAPNNLTLGNNVTITGTLIAAGDVHVSGTAHLQSFNMPALSGTSAPVRLPVAVVRSNFILDSTGSGDATGVVLAQSEFRYDTGPKTAAFAVLGRVISDSVVIRGRTQWTLSSAAWSAYWTSFNNQLSLPAGQRINYWPQWLSTVNLAPAALLTVKPDSTTMANHWQDPSQPFYVADPQATGLQWDLVSWSDNP